MKGSCNELILTTRPISHQFTNVFETGISEHLLLIYTIFKSTYTKMEVKILSKRRFKNSSEQAFLHNLKQGVSNAGNFSEFNNEFKNTLNDHAPIKASKVRRNTNHMSIRFLEKK